jgi:hypothetical protein
MKRNHRNRYFGRNAPISLCALLFCSSPGAWAQSIAPAVKANAPFSIRATYLLGLENAKSNGKGTLSIQDNALQFQQGGKPAIQVKITSVRNVFLGGESQQVGGLPMTLGKAAAPYEAGRVLSLFTHKKYDTLTVEYVDSDGGIHGAIFQLGKGQGELVSHQLAARGVSPRPRDDEPTKQSNAEVTREKAVNSSDGSVGSTTQWSVQVERVDPQDLDLAHSFQVAIYENLLQELNKANRFHQVFRDGDRKAGEVPKLLVLKTTVEKYTPGSETRRAVTTVSGATKLTVRNQLLTREGKTVLECTVNGNVRFFGSNLRATHNLARNIAKVMKQSSWSGSEQPAAIVSRQL